MTEQTREGTYLMTRACLLLLAWQWAQQALATPCPSGELRIITKDERECCSKCKPYPGDNSMCQNATGACKCRQGYACAGRNCFYCKKLPECAEGEELVKIGSEDFTFKCHPCKQGTYSNVKNGWCRDWTDCEASGFLTRQQGNRTHNSVCGFTPIDMEQVPVANPPLYTTVLAILTAVAIFVLILLTFFLHFCMWSLKKKKYYIAEDLEHNFPRPLEAPQLAQHGEETYSCQFPEEEHGGKTAEEKHCYSCPQSLQGPLIN